MNGVISDILDLPEDRVLSLKLAFDEFDADHNGTIDLNEFMNAMESLGKPLTQVQAQSIAVDTSVADDCQIHFIEFCEMWKAEDAKMSLTATSDIEDGDRKPPPPPVEKLPASPMSKPTEDQSIEELEAALAAEFPDEYNALGEFIGGEDSDTGTIVTEETEGGGESDDSGNSLFNNLVEN